MFEGKLKGYQLKVWVKFMGMGLLYFNGFDSNTYVRLAKMERK